MDAFALPNQARGVRIRIWRIAVAFALGLCAAGVAAAQEKAKEAELIYPRQAAPAEAPTAAPVGHSNATLILLGLGAAAAGGFMLWRQRRSPGGSGAQARKLAVTETRPLGNRQYLVVADYDGRKFLLGVCPGRIDLLSPLGSDDDKDGDL